MFATNFEKDSDQIYFKNWKSLYRKLNQACRNKVNEGTDIIFVQILIIDL